jgi:uncharacterized protein RhaS with RHS repeats
MKYFRSLLAGLTLGVLALGAAAQAADIVYEYDARGRLVKIVYPPVNGQTKTVTYEYDASGNRTKVTVTLS